MWFELDIHAPHFLQKKTQHWQNSKVAPIMRKSISFAMEPLRCPRIHFLTDRTIGKADDLTLCETKDATWAKDLETVPKKCWPLCSQNKTSRIANVYQI